jgi:hypothetical protein
MLNDIAAVFALPFAVHASFLAPLSGVLAHA